MSAVTRLPKDPGPAAWNAILPAVPGHAPLDERATADWLVIGAGFAGLAAARRLATLRPEDRVVVLDAKRVAEGPAGRNSGFMIDLPHDLDSDDYGGDVEADRRQIELNRAGIDFASAMARDFGLPDEAFRPVGKVNAAATEKGMTHNARYATHLKRLGEDHAHLDTAAMKALTGSDYYLGGLYTPGTAMIQPAMFVRGVAAALVSNRVRVHENSPVTSLDRINDVWRATTPGGSVEAPKVILAVNGHIQSFGFFERRLAHVFTYASMTRALTPEEVASLGGAPVWSATPADPAGTTVRRLSGVGGDRIVVRNRFTYDPSLEIDDAKLARVTRDHDASFKARFPMLSDVAMEYRWAGRLCLSRNGAAAFGEVDEGLYAACCQNGLGTAKGTVSGMLAADLATGTGGPLLSLMTAGPAPSAVPPEPFASLGATAAIRWKEWRAGREL
jgi:glycine/D-amino acid oxidase-like deaminating enzyme